MTPPARSEVCFFERDPHQALARRAGVEAVGTLMLMFAATGSAVVAAGFWVMTAGPMLLHPLATSSARTTGRIALRSNHGGDYAGFAMSIAAIRHQRWLRPSAQVSPAGPAH